MSAQSTRFSWNGTWRGLSLSGCPMIFAIIISTQAFAQTDALPLWNDTATKRAIVEFVTKASTEGGADFVPMDDRIAAFDMDGTLTPEHPMPIAVIPVLADIKANVAKNPSLGARPAVAALLRGDLKTVVALGEDGQADIIAAATDGKTTEEVAANVRPMLEKAISEKFGVPYTKTTYKPMRELIELLKKSGFTVYICSGSPVLFTREISEEMFGIPPEHVMGTWLETKLGERDGRTVLVYTGKIGHLNDKEGKPVTLNLAIGKRPVFVGGNEGGRGDIAMMRWSRDRDGPSFQILINHDDAEREFAYSESDSYSLDAAKQFGFHVVSMTDDWKEIVGK
ncbi:MULTISPECIES: HAD family hydrolase [unclassified Rhizobium]|uniref:HAD family hydrolase n=1 Tax=unclassified Rhizobium TaxID=2613769 RepID=UPI001ADB2845|nr:MULTISPECIES: haloacid dehalogenase-like hydrolase [unclassified Rhizobium]MBO9124933.1 haloacid dehalogenase-like hydrolase [Rhizobium sp. 16-488-2b]MBO9175518.1 haloacid dehalogenase-like hydrolase [Rhizobium sp. 16-488-2a]